MTPAVYNLLLAALSPLAVPALALRALWKGHPPRRIPEKFGRLDSSFHQTRPGAIWLHAVSVGEALSAVALIPQLRRTLPGRSIFVSTSTPTGQALAVQKLAGQVEGVFYAPHDFPWAVRGTLRALRPQLLLVMETEIWPNLFHEARRFGAGLVIVNGRISDRSAPRYHARQSLFGPTLRACDQILAQCRQDAERFIDAGADPRAISVGGNLKYDFEPATEDPPTEVTDLIERLGAGPVLIAGSTREDEEAPLAEAFHALAERRPQALLIVAPRHPGRFEEATRAITAAGLPLIRRSTLTADSKLDLPGVLLLDSLGELASIYPLADVVFVGGSLNGWGGHNVLEPALADKPVTVGPHMQNFRAIADRLAADGGLIQVQTAEELTQAWANLLDHPRRAAEIAHQGRAAALAERGAAARAAEAAALAWSESEAAPAQPPSWLRRIALWPASKLWRLGARLHRGAYDSALLKRHGLPRPAVSVGNLSAGGTGKTPTAFWLLRQLSLRGRRPALLTRGYRRASSAKIIIAAPLDPLGPPHLGDEAAEIHRRLRIEGFDVPIGVGADRHATGEALLKRFPDVDLFVLDDAFQHHRLERDFDLVLVDVTRPPQSDDLLPLGRLRELPPALQRADAVLFTRTVPDLHYDSLIRRTLADLHKPIFRGRPLPVELIHGGTEQRASLDLLRDTPVFAFCGVGSPNAFFRSLEDLGARIVGRLTFRDHHRYTPDDWWRIAKQARGTKADLLLTTEKDLSNLDTGVPAPTRSGAPPLHTLRIDFQVDEADALLDLIDEATS